MNHYAHLNGEKCRQRKQDRSNPNIAGAVIACDRDVEPAQLSSPSWSLLHKWANFHLIN
ncbi:hypothetical protein [aff. Roholtiella sp. LEGE 12411]|uniref:hypothetical protein n=1 Tax=aff. Roholtiella sp. LEGE 12411 TaxID=1828822 RepID=UPI00187E6759|nr:hypothetical protein [aff. Roholtiella sp. LEGE 12411]